MIRMLAKAAACQVLTFARLDAWIARGQPMVLSYHSVVEDLGAARSMPGLAASVAMFGRQLEWLGRRCRFVDLDEVGRALERGERGRGRPLAALTFDDGYRDVRQHALPLLRRWGIPAGVFVVSDALDHGDRFVHDRLFQALTQYLRSSRQTRRPPYDVTRALLASLDEHELASVLAAVEAEAGAASPAPGPASLDWDDVLALRDGGLTIGSHTRSHVPLTRCAPEALAGELRGSRRRLEQRLGVPVVHFAYPDGQFDAMAVRAVEDAGYRFAFTACRHRDPRRPLLTIPRAMLWEHSSLGPRGRFAPSVLACQTYGASPFLDRCLRVHA